MDHQPAGPPTDRCPRCGATLTGAALEGLCPACVATLAFGEPAGASVASPSGDSVRRFGNYELLEEIARGGMGVVFKARQISLNRTVAIKMITSGQLASAAQVQRFRAEAEAVAALQHRNIVAIHEVGEHDGRCFFSMDYVEGESLAALVRKGPLPPARAAVVVREIAEATHYAHQRGTLHRDLKPSNVIIDSLGQPRIIDFGLAKRLDHDSDLTITGQMIGTPSFMPPEQAAANGGDVGPHSDVYSLGAILYFSLTGRPPFAGRSLEATISQVLNEEPVPPRRLVPGIPRDLETVCLKCLEKDGTQRYQSAQQLADELGRFLRGEPVEARPAGRGERAWRWCRRHPAVASLGISLAVTLAALAVVLAWLARPTGNQQLTPMPVLSGCGASGLIEGKIYRTSPCDGNSGRGYYFHAYHPASNVWHTLRPSPAIHSDAAAGVLGGRFFLAGGHDEVGLIARVDAYDPSLNQWQQLAPLSAPRTYCAGAVLDGKLFVLGGHDNTNVLSLVEVYDPALRGWAAGPSLTSPRSSALAAVVNGTLFIMGGTAAMNGEPRLATVEALNRDVTWTARAPMPVPVTSGAVAVMGDTIYVVGGNSPTGAVAFLQAYQVTSNQWTLLPPMPEPRHAGHSAEVVDGKLYVIGGWFGRLPHDDVFVFDPRRNAWRR